MKNNLNKNNKTLLFGNGISIRYDEEHYGNKLMKERLISSIIQYAKSSSPENLMKNFKDEDKIKIKNMFKHSKEDYKWIKSTIYYQTIQLIEKTEEINEIIFWKILKEIWKTIIIIRKEKKRESYDDLYLLNYVSEDNIDKLFDLTLTKENETKYKSWLEILIKDYFNNIIKVKSEYLESNFLLKDKIDPFKKRLASIIQSFYDIIMLTICITLAYDIDKNQEIKICYDDFFIDKLKYDYNKIYTTNYYLGDNLEKIEKIPTISYIHGKIKWNENILNHFKYQDYNFDQLIKIFGKKNGDDINSINIWFRLSNILFGETYEDKENLANLLGVKITKITIDNNTELDIVGLSTTADEPLLKELFKDEKIIKINIYYHTKDSDKVKYEKLIEETFKNDLITNKIDNENTIYKYKDKVINVFTDKKWFLEIPEYKSKEKNPSYSLS